MSNLPANLDETIQETQQEPQREPPPDSEPAKPAPPPAAKSSGGGGVAWLALLAALAVGGWNGYQYMERQRTDEGERALLNEQARRLTDLERRLAVTTTALNDLQQTAERRQRALEEGLSGVRTLAGLRERNGWMVAEAEYLVRLARHTLDAKGDAATAAQLLADADRRLAELGDPALHTPRTLLAADIAALKGLPPEPLSDHAAALARLMDQVEQLPLPIPHNPAGNPPGRPQTPADPWQWRDWLGEIEQWLEKSVVLRRDGERPAPLITPEAHYLLSQNLRLTLEGARLALYRDDERGFRTALGQARRWVTEHFDGADPATRGLLRELARLEQAPLKRVLPDLEESLRALTRAAAPKSPLPAEGAQP